MSGAQKTGDAGRVSGVDGQAFGSGDKPFADGGVGRARDHALLVDGAARDISWKKNKHVLLTFVTSEINVTMSIICRFID